MTIAEKKFKPIQMANEVRIIYKKRIGILCAWIFMIGILKWPDSAADAARSAMEQWYHGVAPSLFPFMMLMPLITCPEAMLIYEKIFGKLMHFLFALPGCTAPAVVIGMVAGSPAGVIAAGTVAENTGLEKRELLRIAVCSCGLSPGFLISGIGAGIMKRPDIGQNLLITQLITQLIMLFATRRMRGGEKIRAKEKKNEIPGAKAAVISVITIAGYMVFFNVLAKIASVIWKGKYADYILSTLEISTGANRIAGMGLEETQKIIILAGMCGFGGICICTQNMKILSKYGITVMEYLPWKVAIGVVSACVTAVQLRMNIDFLSIMDVQTLYFASLLGIILAIPALFGFK